MFEHARFEFVLIQGAVVVLVTIRKWLNENLCECLPLVFAEDAIPLDVGEGKEFQDFGVGKIEMAECQLEVFLAHGVFLAEQFILVGFPCGLNAEFVFVVAFWCIQIFLFVVFGLFLFFSSDFFFFEFILFSRQCLRLIRIGVFSLVFI